MNQSRPSSSPPGPRRVRAALALTFAIAGCSHGVGNNLPAKPTAAVTGNSNLPVGFDLGFAPTAALADVTAAGVRLPAIGATGPRELVFLGFSTAARSDDGDGSGTPLARDTTTDGNGASDVFVAVIAAQDVDTSAFSQSLAGKFRHPRCTTCHSMQAADTLAFVSSPLPHAGPLPGPTFPNNDPATCQDCHVTSTNFPVPGWQAPAASFDFRHKTVAELAAAAQNVPVDELEHFVSDRRVLWALDSGVLPGVGGRNAVADDDHDGVLEPEDTDGVIRTVPGGSAGFLRDIMAWRDGGMQTSNAAAVADLTLVSRDTGGTAAGNGASRAPRLFWVDNPTFDPANAAATNPIGTLYVAFESDATDLVATTDTNGTTDVFRAAVEVRADEDQNGGAAVGGLNLHFATGATVLASAVNGGTAAGNGASTRPAIGGANGEQVVFESLADGSSLVAGFTDGNGASAPDVYVRDVDANTTRLLSHSVSNQATGGDGASERPAIASNGRAVAFESDATDLIASDTNGVRDVFHARIDQVPPYQRVRSSVTAAGDPGSAGACTAASVHEDGNGRIRVAFQSDKTDLATVAAATNVFLFDSATGGTTLLNQAATPGSNAAALGDGPARAPVIAGDGSIVAFESDATNLDVLRDDRNRAADVFLVETSQVDNGLVLPFRASVSGTEGAEGNAASTAPAFGVFAGSVDYATGFAVYRTAATNLGTSDTTDVMLSFVGETSGVIADFSVSATLAPAPLTVTFTDESSGNPTAWEWDFDNDGTVDSRVQNPTHVFATPGTYTVKLVARSALSEGTKIAADVLRAIGPVAADFTATPAVGGQPLVVTFTDTSTEQPFAWEWDFENDGTVDSTAQNPSHTYSALGSYAVRLVATNELGPNEIVRPAAVQVFPPVNAEFTGTPLAGTAPHAVTFTDATTGSPSAWAWDFENDGVVDSTEQNPMHTYTEPGNYTVVLSATGPAGTDVRTRATYVAVGGPVVADFTSSATAALAVQFTDATTGTVSSWQWDFDDDGNVDSTLQNPTHIYPGPGTYSVRMTASGAGGSDVEFKRNHIVVVDLEPAKDTSIYQENTGNSNGRNPQLVCGNAATLTATQVGIRRALVEFDVAGTVSAGATVLAANLQLTNTYAPLNPIGNVNVTVSPVTREWGEAPDPGSNGGIGGGTPAVAGDATWASAIVGVQTWTSAGGDFGGASASATVGGVGVYTWVSSSLRADVQSWLTPANNHGWILRGSEVSGVRSAKVFGSLQNATAADRPRLRITYRPAL
ncbi:MAG: PKD domain-containing protein [Planctomycetes bacterium]|nr:PKD domain-containing protein [Planctomycetota bacterium]